jgi:acetyl-CoA/propionyl-CoA carboxylase biotin carboxyl carrier protein
MFDKILIANRGEIAVRIIGAARGLGIRTVAVFSEADAGAQHVRLADEAICIGPASASRSYLDIAAVIEAARESGAQAVHPGYGFLSENAAFARAVIDAAMVFIGPDPATIETMSDKVAARAAAIAAGVPVLPGSNGAVTGLAEAHEIAERIGFPVAVKASFGGGGRGIRVAADADALEAAMAAAGREAGAAFGRSEIFLESFLLRPRHVEVQIIGDTLGSVLHLGDRDCTVQRRHQKMIEEAPAPDLDPGMRAAMLEAAVALCRSVGYVGAGTVEFLVDRAAGAFHFLEMNTRLQVEHGVTEMVTGIDIVETQIMIAAGAPLGFSQADVAIDGHAIQARISAEDPWDGFRPTPGQIGDLRVPLAPWTRADFGVESGDLVQPHYDSMVGKLLAWGRDRDSARRRLAGALRRLDLGGVPTTAPYAADVLDQPDFAAVRHFTGSVEHDWAPDPAHRPAEIAPQQDLKETADMPMTERRIRLSGPTQRKVAVFGSPAMAAPRAVPSPRAGRSGAGPVSDAGASSEGWASAPMDGLVVQIPVALGDDVKAGDPVLILEAMKMEVVIAAPRDGKVLGLSCTQGAPVAKGQALVEIG